ncbi:glycosyltransferase, partial [bacterium]
MASISAIIPVLDEEAALPALLESLKTQREVQIEIIAVDGGSADGSEAAFKTHAPEGSLWLNAPKGRASQMNAGAKAASGEYLLFIHADSLLEGENLLRDALCLLLDEKNSGQKIAGKWAVDFCLPENSFAAFFMQAKTALERADAYAGDQGLLLARSYFLELGGFDETPP